MKSKKAKLGFFTYSIRFVKQPEENCGETDIHNKDIWINTRYSEEVQRETLMHELLHVALDDCSALKVEEMKPNDREEDIVRTMSPRLMQFMCDNKWIRELLYGK